MVSPVQSISPMHTNPLNLPPILPVDQTSPIIDRTFGFDVENDTYYMQLCVYSRVEDTYTMEHCPDIDAAMEDALVGSCSAKSKDATEIEYTLRNASIGGCKDALPAFRSIDDDEDEGGSEDLVDACIFDNLSLSGVGSARASHESNSNLAKYSKHGNEE